MNKFKTDKFMIFIVFLTIGLKGIFFQLLITRRILATFYGNELSIGIILSFWLLSIAIGSYFAGNYNKKEEAKKIFLISFAFSSLIAPISTLSSYYLRKFSGVSTGEVITFYNVFYAILFLIGPFCFLHGCQFISAVNFFSPFKKEDKNYFPIVYLYEVLGDIVGGIIFSFLLIKIFTPLTISILISILDLLIINIVLFKFFNSEIKLLKYFFSALFLIMIFSPIFLKHIKRNLFIKECKLINSSFDLIKYKDSLYGNLMLVKYLTQYTLLENGKALFSFPDSVSSQFDSHTMMVQHPSPKTVLLIGGYPGLVCEMLKHNLTKIVYTQLDPEVLNIVKNNLPESEKSIFFDDRVEVAYKDGITFLNDVDYKFDMILLFISEPSTIFNNRYYTKEFFYLCSKKLNKDGVLAFRMISTENYVGNELKMLNASIYKTLLSIFPYVIVLPGDSSLFLASFVKGSFSSDEKVLQKRYIERDISAKYFSKSIFRNLYIPEKVAYLNRILKNEKMVRINRADKPLTYYLNFLVWNKITGMSNKIFGTIEKLKFRDFLFAIIFLAAVLSLFLSINLKDRIFTLAVNFSVFTTGFFGMVSFTTLIYLFQSLNGYIYSVIGILIAVFMMGIFSAGIIFNSINKFYKSLKMLLLVDFFICLFPALIYFFIFNLLKGILVYILIFIIGSFVGVTFIIASNIISGDKIFYSRIYAGDLIGSCIGALLSGGILYPLIGVLGTFKIVSFLKLISLVLLLFSYFRKLIKK